MWLNEKKWLNGSIWVLGKLLKVLLPPRSSSSISNWWSSGNLLGFAWKSSSIHPNYLASLKTIKCSDIARQDAWQKRIYLSFLFFFKCKGSIDGESEIKSSSGIRLSSWGGSGGGICTCRCSFGSGLSGKSCSNGGGADSRDSVASSKTGTKHSRRCLTAAGELSVEAFLFMVFRWWSSTLKFLLLFPSR